MPDSQDVVAEVAGISERELRQVLAMVDGTEIEELEVGIPGGHLKLKRRIASESDTLTATSLGAPTPDSAGEFELPDESFAVTSPLVGTFHPLVAEGDAVTQGQRVGRIEAMGMPTNVEAPQAGHVLQILAADGSGVEYGQPLLKLLPELAE